MGTKRIPVYLNENELKMLLEWKEGADANHAYWEAQNLGQSHIDLQERLKSELETFEPIYGNVTEKE